MTKVELTNFIRDILGIAEEEPLSQLILRQIHDYTTKAEYRFDYLDIARALSYFVDIEGKRVEWEKYGIGIVGAVMPAAKKYYAEQAALKKRREAEAQRYNGLQSGPVVKIGQTKNNGVRRKHIDLS